MLTGLFVLAVLFAILLYALTPETPATRGPILLASFIAILLGTIAGLWRNDRNTFWFLVSSAVFRDGVSAVMGRPNSRAHSALAARSPFRAPKYVITSMTGSLM